jgi:hypothetical protein
VISDIQPRLDFLHELTRVAGVDFPHELDAIHQRSQIPAAVGQKSVIFTQLTGSSFAKKLQPIRQE